MTSYQYPTCRVCKLQKLVSNNKIWKLTAHLSLVLYLGGLTLNLWFYSLYLFPCVSLRHEDKCLFLAAPSLLAWIKCYVLIMMLNLLFQIIALNFHSPLRLLLFPSGNRLNPEMVIKISCHQYRSPTLYPGLWIRSILSLWSGIIMWHLCAFKKREIMKWAWLNHQPLKGREISSAGQQEVRNGHSGWPGGKPIFMQTSQERDSFRKLRAMLRWQCWGTVTLVLHLQATEICQL